MKIKRYDPNKRNFGTGDYTKKRDKECLGYVLIGETLEEMEILDDIYSTDIEIDGCSHVRIDAISEDSSTFDEMRLTRLTNILFLVSSGGRARDTIKKMWERSMLEVKIKK